MANDYTRRKFIRDSVITSVGAALLASPLEILAADNKPVFKRAPHSPFYFPSVPYPDFQVFVLPDLTFNKPEFSFMTDFVNQDQNFLVGFYKGQDLAKLPGSDQVRLAQILLHSFVKRYIMWFDSFKVSDMNLAPKINMGDPAHLTINFSLGALVQTDEQYKVKVYNPTLGGTRVRFDDQRFSIVIENDNDFVFAANGQDSLFKQIEIPLAVTSNPGSLQFKTYRFPNGSIKPYSPYFSKKKSDNSTQILKISYFEESFFKKNVSLQVLLYPFARLSNDTLPASYIYFKQTDPVVWNGVNEFGVKLISRDLSNFSARLAVLKFDGDDDTATKYLFIPWNKLTLMNPPGPPKFQGRHLLLGYTGTERVSLPQQGLEVYFSPSESLSVSDDGQTLETAGDSITSKMWFAPQVYHLDAERAPLFENNLPDANHKSVNYKAIPQGTLSSARLNNSFPIPEALILPLIPMFGLREHPDLLDDFIELEKVFLKVRLRNFKPGLNLPQVLPTNFVTPQGFLKDRPKKQYDFIKISDKPVEIPGTVLAPGHDIYKFSISGIDADFNLSISKEDVFFVLTPGLLKDIHSQVGLDVFFGIHGFEIDLRFTVAQQLVADERILVFKYSRHSVEELMRDPSKWSNWGIYKGVNAAVLNDLSRTISDKFDKFQEKYNVGEHEKNEDYRYVDQVIRQDSNWNGVFILNIPIADNNNLPAIFTGLTSSQHLHGETDGDKLALNNTTLNFNYVAFPVNKTEVNGGKVEIKATSFYGLIDYDIFAEKVHPNQPAVKKFMDNDGYRFILSRLLVRFENSEIRHFKSYVFLKMGNLFEDAISFNPVVLSNADSLKNVVGLAVDNCVRLTGNYQKNSDGADQFTFGLDSDIEIKMPQNIILTGITIHKASFSYTSTKTFRFDFDGDAFFAKSFGTFEQLLSFDGVEFKNFGLAISTVDLSIPKIDFDLSRFFVLPKINFNGGGFLSSFPIQFNRFQIFNILPDLSIPDFDFLDIPVPTLNIHEPNCSLWSMVFNFDLGTLGDLSFLKMLKGEFLFGWSKKGGFKFGLKLNGPSGDGLHINLFGALKLDIARVDICPINIVGQRHYILRLVNARLTILGLELPGKNAEIDGFLFAAPHTRTAWLMGYYSDNLLTLGVGQGVGPVASMQNTTVEDCLNIIRELFNPALDPCHAGAFDFASFYQPARNWLVASENIIPDDWKSVVDMKFIFNDPILYGVYLKIADIFSIDVLYKKLSDSLGIWSLEFALDPSIRTIDAGELVITLPNLGIDISTNGDWKLDIGYPKVNDWSRSCLIQFRPFVGWAGFYIAKINTVALSLFAPYPKIKDGSISIIQAGFAVRIGIGAYLDKGIFYVGASISVYGTMEGAFGFDKPKAGLSQLLPNHFVLAGRIGAIAELVGYVDFKIVKAVLHIVLRVEFGMTIALINGTLQAVPLYIEGEVSVELDFTICCFSVFGHHICITIHLSFHAFVRFEYVLGHNDNSQGHLLPEVYPESIEGGIGEIPVAFIPAFTKSQAADGTESARLIYNFGIPFFGIAAAGGKLTNVGDQNLISEAIIKPLFDAILNKFELADGMPYSHLRDVLLNARLKGKKEILFTFPDYRPVFLVGYSRPADMAAADYHDYRQFISVHFKLTEADVDTWFTNTAADPCRNDAGNCPFRVIPVPVAAKTKVVKKGEMEWSTDGGFSIQVDNIVPDKLNAKTFTAGPELTNTQLSDAKKQFDSFKTQFNDLPDGESTMGKLVADSFTLKEDVLISEYFRLIGLLVLEMYYNFFADLDANRKGETAYDPIITTAKIISDGDWKLNTASNIEKLIGQLNYFYNNGLRLADFGPMKTTQGFFELLKQEDIVKGFSDRKNIDSFAGGLDLNNKPITFDNVNITLNSINTDGKEVNLAGELFPNAASLSDYLKNAMAPLQMDLNGMKSCFKPSIISPFELNELKIAIVNSSLGSNVKPGNGPAIPYTQNDFKFFAVPKIVAEVFDDAAQQCNINLFSMTAGTRDDRMTTLQPSTVNKTVCTNIEVRVKVHLEDGKTTSLEFSDVLIEDLYLAGRLKDFLDRNQGAVEDIKIYKKDDNLLVHPLPVDGLKILKTNISSKTHPPIIIDKSNLLAADQKVDNVYYAGITDKVSFMRLFWEGLTTNYGGFYFFNDSNNASFVSFDLPEGASADEQTKLLQKQFTLIVSFEAVTSPGSNAVAGFNNFLKVINNQGGQNLFADLDAQSQYLYISPTTVNLEEVVVTMKEYHATIPAHCFGFEVARSGENADFGQYLPLDYELSAINWAGPGATLQHRDKVFPIMPKNKKIDKDMRMIDTATDTVIKENIVAGMQFYNHIMPVIPYAKQDKEGYDPNLINRYQAVSATTKYNLKFSVRDIYGFRAFELPANLPYAHVYFDKLVPVNAWPFIKFSYWCGNPLGETNWNLKVEFFDDQSQKHLNSGKKEIEKQLYTILAQVSDPNCQVSVLPKFIEGDQVGNRVPVPADQLTAVIKKAICLATGTPSPANVNFPVSFTIPVEGLKTQLAPYLEIRRVVAPEMFVQLPAGMPGIETLEHDSVKWVKTPLTLVNNDRKNPDDTDKCQENSLNALNTLLSVQHADFTIGVGLDEHLRKVSYLIDKRVLSGLTTGIVFNKPTDYYGIRPYSNRLWSGNYAPDALPVSTFTDVDLDTSLRIVLSMVDNLLGPLNINHIDSVQLNTLVNCKKRLVKGCSEIADLSTADAELSTKLELIDTAGVKKSNEFENFLLEKLANFYNTDGIVIKELARAKGLAGHRLTINIKNDPTYEKFNIQSSKLDYRNTETPQWTVLFDYLGNNADSDDSLSPAGKPKTSLFYDLSISPEISHIEYDIKPALEVRNGIEQSKWIQLITPIALDQVKIPQFPAVTRQYPPNPIIITNQTAQSASENASLPWSTDLGKWCYNLGVKNLPKLFTGNDKMVIELSFQSLMKPNHFDVPPPVRNFEGFVAYWSAQIAGQALDTYILDATDKIPKPNLNRLANIKKFIAELDTQLGLCPAGLQPVLAAAPAATEPNKVTVTLLFDGVQWTLEDITNENCDTNQAACVNLYTQNHVKVNKQQPVDIEHMSIGDFNVFVAPYYVSVKPALWVTRNENVNNPNFRYKTAVATPPDWTTVHLKYAGPIFIKDSLQGVFLTVSDMGNASLPFKAVLKHLISIHDLDKVHDLKIPSIPVEYMEFSKGAAVPGDVDHNFNGYENGNAAVGITISNVENNVKDMNNLPVFDAFAVIKV